jgi:tetratricopeptide (TPR) repeat protein
MAEVTLSKYCDEARELIRADSYDQAIAICRHILRHYPRYVRAYRLLGEACLEKGDYVEAANLFKRVLGADMEDMVVYVGLGIVFDEQGALDEAIWQLERAFELNPGNAEIRKELQRLYGDRDGAAPPKLKLTSAALGRLYMREELHQRATDEFRAVLEEDPDRADIQIALAQALWWSEQRQEAARICEALLEQYPNCLKANLILGEILLNAGRESEARSLLETAQAMDPENVVAHELFHDRSPLPRETVTVPRLDQEELDEEVEELRSEAPVAAKGTGARKQGPPSKAGKRLDEATPDWLRKLQEEEEKESAPEEVTPPSQAQEMPAWLRELADESPAETPEAEDAGDRPRDEVGEGVPGWLAGLTEEGGDLPSEEILPPAGPETVAEREEEPSAADEEVRVETPEAFAPPEDVEGEGIERAPSGAEPGEESLEADESPDWLSRLRTEAPHEDESPPIEAGEDESQEWLRSLRQEATLGQPAPEPPIVEEELESTPLAAAPPEEGLPATGEEPPEITGQTMDRLRETMPGEEASIDEIMTWMEASKALLAEEEIPESALGELQAAEESELLSEATEADQIPTWLRDLRPEVEGAEEALLDEDAGAPTEEAAIPTQEDEIPTWLMELRPKAAEEEELPRPSEVVSEFEDEDRAPEWEEVGPLTGPEPIGEGVSPEAEETPGRAPGLVEEEAAEEPFVAPEEPTAGPEEAGLPMAEGEEMPSWLRDLRAEAVREEPSLPLEEAEVTAEETAVPGVEQEEVPSWLRDLRAEAVREEPSLPQAEPESPVEEAPPPVVEEEEMPSWLRQLRAEAASEEPAYPPEEREFPPEAAEPPPARDEEMPPWLQQLREEAYREEPLVSAEEAETLPHEDLPTHMVEAELPSWLEELKAEVAREGPELEAEEVETPTGLERPPTGEAPSRPTRPPEKEQPVETIRPEALEVADAAAPPVDEGVPSWLRELRAQAAEGETGPLLERVTASDEAPLPPLKEEELPSWLRDLRAGAAERAAVAPAAAAEEALDEGTAWPDEEAEAVAEEPVAPPAVEEEAPAGETYAEEEEISPERPLEETPQPGWDVGQYVEYLEANPRDHTARLALARAYSQAGDLDQAALQYETLLSLGGMIHEVASDLEATAESAPDHLHTHELLADAYMRSGQLQKALDKYRWLRVMLTR